MQLAQALEPGGAAGGATDEADEAALVAQLKNCTGAELRQELRRRVAALASAEGKLPPPSDAQRLGEEGYAPRWYAAKLSPEEEREGREPPEGGWDGEAGRRRRRQVARAFLEGMAWTMRYYLEGPVGRHGWGWFYRFPCAPLALDLAATEPPPPPPEPPVGGKGGGLPCVTPLQQLCLALPPASAAALPAALREVAALFPAAFPPAASLASRVDYAGKRFKWQGSLHLPFVEAAAFAPLYEALRPGLSPAEAVRDQLRSASLYLHTSRLAALGALAALDAADAPDEAPPAPAAALAWLARPPSPAEAELEAAYCWLARPPPPAEVAGAAAPPDDGAVSGVASSTCLGLLLGSLRPASPAQPPLADERPAEGAMGGVAAATSVLFGYLDVCGIAELAAQTRALAAREASPTQAAAVEADVALGVKAVVVVEKEEEGEEEEVVVEEEEEEEEEAEIEDLRLLLAEPQAEEDEQLKAALAASLEEEKEVVVEEEEGRRWGRMSSCMRPSRRRWQRRRRPRHSASRGRMIRWRRSSRGISGSEQGPLPGQGAAVLEVPKVPEMPEVPSRRQGCSQEVPLP